jgi:hypothetical protein
VAQSPESAFQRLRFRQPGLSLSCGTANVLKLALEPQEKTSFASHPKEANLMRTAVRYRVDASKIITRVTAELSSKRRGARNKPRRTSSGGKHQTASAS